VPQGKVKWFSTEKAFGFIEQENDSDIFVHVTGLADGVTAIDKDQLVEYEVEQGRKGPQATSVRPATAAAAPAAAAEPEADAEVDAEPEADAEAEGEGDAGAEADGPEAELADETEAE
jgi:CspA family cold shock protein